MPVRDVAPDEWECTVFIAVAEHRTYAAAAKALSARTGDDYGSRAVAKVVAKIEGWLGAPAFEQTVGRAKVTTERGEDFLRAARTIVGEYHALRQPDRSSQQPTLACMPHHIHVVARAEAALARRSPIAVQFLERACYVGDAFNRYAVGRLQRDLYQLIMGPPVPGDRTLVCKDLYEARLEAMMPAATAPPAISLTALVSDHELFLPPPGSRSRRLFQDRIAAWGVPDVHLQTRAERESRETATSVLRVHCRADREHHVVVAASDVALAFKLGREFAGPPAQRFRWVPIYHRDEQGTVHQLTQKVCVTMKRAAAPSLFPVVEALRKAVAHVPELATTRLDV